MMGKSSIDQAAVAASGFSRVLFVAAKWFSILFALLALLALLGAGLLVANSFIGSGFDTPKFSKEKSELAERKIVGQENNVKSQKEKLELNAEYGSDILEIITKHKVTGVKTDQIIDLMVNLDKKYRSKFVKGMRAYLDDGMELMQSESNVKDDTSTMLTYEYIGNFKKALSMEGSSDAARKAERMSLLMVMIACMVLLILAMILPVLVQVERNTRNQSPIAKLPPPVAAPDAPQVASASPSQQTVKCSKCGTANDPANGFCENCGQPMK